MLTSTAPPSSDAPTALPLRLLPLTPDLPAATIEPDRRATVGRRATCDVAIAQAHVSRAHAELFHESGHWYVIDHGSLAGTRIEGQPVAAGIPTRLADSDRLAFGPCTFSVRIGDTPTTELDLDDASVAPGTMVRTIDDSMRGPDRQEVRQFASIIRSLASAPDRRELFERTAAFAVQMLRFGRAAVVLPDGDRQRRLEALAVRSASGEPVIVPTDAEGGEAGTAGPGNARPYSRRLVDAALAGDAVVLEELGEVNQLQTVSDLRIHAAVCVPILVDDVVLGCLYLDSRESEHAASTDAAPYAGLFADAAGLVLGNLGRADLELRQRTLQVQLEGAQAAQQGLLPEPAGIAGPVRWAMRMEPGLVVAGDLFDVVPIDEDRTGVLIGDVVGHGAGPGFRMAMSQPVVRTELARTADPVAAVSLVHETACRSFPPGEFLTLWVGVVHRSGRVDYVNAGHGHVAVRPRGGAPRPFDLVSNPPVGIDHGRPFEAGRIELAPSEQLLLWSDGAVEQAAEGGRRFDPSGLDACVAAAPDEPEALVGHVIGAIDRFRGPTARTDDTTIAVVERA